MQLTKLLLENKYRNTIITEVGNMFIIS